MNLDRLSRARRLSLAVLALVFLAGGWDCSSHSGVSVPAAPAARRAVWVWESETGRLLESGSYRRGASSFLREKGIGTVYLYADRFRDGRNPIRDRPLLYQRVVEHFHREGLRVYALLGSAELHTEEYVLPEKRDEAMAMLDRVLDYNARSQARQRFDGISLDIEPHVLDRWEEERELLGLRFLELGRALMALKESRSPGLDLGAAIPFWLDRIEGIEWEGTVAPLGRHSQRLFDHVVIMDYRRRADGEDGIVANARTEIEWGRELGKPVVIGVEVADVEPAWISFNDGDEEDLERELAATAEAFRGEPAFAGFAIHHLSAYREWVRRPR